MACSVRPNDARMARGLELTGLLLERMRTIASEDGSRVVLVLIPLGVQLSDKQFAEFVARSPDRPPRRRSTVPSAR